MWKETILDVGGSVVVGDWLRRVVAASSKQLAAIGAED